MSGFGCSSEADGRGDLARRDANDPKEELARFLRLMTTINRSPAWRLLPRNVGRLHQLEIGGDVVLEEPVEFRNGHR